MPKAPSIARMWGVQLSCARADPATAAKPSSSVAIAAIRPNPLTNATGFPRQSMQCF
jgi:hypothetical protein